MDKYHFESELLQVKTRFLNFQTKRRAYDQLLRRETPTNLPPELESIQEGIDYRTAAIETASGDWQDILTTNPTLFDLHTISQDESDKETGRDILMFTARGWEYENQGRWWDRAVGESQVRHGLAVMQLCYEAPTEPTTDAKDASESLKQRDRKMRARRHPFTWKSCDIYSVYWMGDETVEGGPTFFAMETMVPFIDARRDYVKRQNQNPADDLRLDFDGAGQCGWYGEPQARTETTSELINTYGGQVRVVTIDALDPDGAECQLPGCDHKIRKIRVYICGEGQDPNEDTLYDEYESPFPGCSFFVIGGRMSLASRDPDSRFIPMIKQLYVEGQYENYLTTHLVTMIRADYGANSMYVDGTSADPRLAPEDGAGALIDFSQAKEGFLPWSPGEVKRLPRAFSQHLATELSAHRQAMQEAMPNKWLTGQADTEMANGTGTMGLQQAAQASLPASTLLAQSDSAILLSRRYEYHAIRFWGMADSSATTKYYAVMTGNNKGIEVMGKQPTAGDVYWIDAKKLELDFDLEILTENKTQVQQQTEWAVKKDQYQNGVATPEQLIRASGVRDVEGQKELLRAAGIRANFAPYQERLENEYLLTTMSRLIGFDLTHLLDMPIGALSPQTAGGATTQSNGAPNMTNTPGNPAPQMNRSAQDLAYAAGSAVGGPTGGATQ